MLRHVIAKALVTRHQSIGLQLDRRCTDVTGTGSHFFIGFSLPCHIGDRLTILQNVISNIRKCIFFILNGVLID